MLRLRTALVPSIVFVLSGCPAPGPASLDEAPARFASSFCALYERCGNPVALRSLFDGRPCEDAFGALAEDTVFARAEEAVARGTVIYRPEQFEACLAELDAGGCDPSAGGGCTEAFEGTVADGGDCVWSEECVSNRCVSAEGVCPGRCAPFTPEGGACVAFDECGAGLACVAGTCTRILLSAEGEPCDPSTGRSCAGIDLECQGVTPDAAGTCVNWRTAFAGALGSPCAPADGDYCDPGLSCAFDMAAGGFTCQASVAAGAACTVAVPELCPAGQYCAAEGVSGTCAALPAAGAACTRTGLCAAGLRCTGSLCAAPARIGDACTADAQCLSNACDGGVCAIPEC